MQFGGTGSSPFTIGLREGMYPKSLNETLGPMSANVVDAEEHLSLLRKHTVSSYGIEIG